MRLGQDGALIFLRDTAGFLGDGAGSFSGDEVMGLRRSLAGVWGREEVELGGSSGLVGVWGGSSCVQVSPRLRGSLKALGTWSALDA